MVILELISSSVEHVDVLSTGGDVCLPGHFTSRHVECAATLCAEPRPMAKTFFARGAFRYENSNSVRKSSCLWLKNRLKVTKKE